MITFDKGILSYQKVLIMYIHDITYLKQKIQTKITFEKTQIISGGLTKQHHVCEFLMKCFNKVPLLAPFVNT